MPGPLQNGCSAYCTIVTIDNDNFLQLTQIMRNVELCLAGIRLLGGGMRWEGLHHTKLVLAWPEPGGLASKARARARPSVSCHCTGPAYVNSSNDITPHSHIILSFPSCNSQTRCNSRDNHVSLIDQTSRELGIPAPSPYPQLS